MKVKKTLMWQDREVAALTLDQYGKILTVDEIMQQGYLPVCARNAKDAESVKKALQLWLNHRTIREDREDYSEFRDEVRSEGMNPSAYVSFFDRYWLRSNLDVSWEDYSPQRVYAQDSDSVYSHLLKHGAFPTVNYDADSPNLTLPFKEPAFWVCKNGKTYLAYPKAYAKMTDGTKTAGAEILPGRKYQIFGEELFCCIPMPVPETVEYIPFYEFYYSLRGEDITDGNIPKDDYEKICGELGLPKDRYRIPDIYNKKTVRIPLELYIICDTTEGGRAVDIVLLK